MDCKFLLLLEQSERNVASSIDFWWPSLSRTHRAGSPTAPEICTYSTRELSSSNEADMPSPSTVPLPFLQRRLAALLRLAPDTLHTSTHPRSHSNHSSVVSSSSNVATMKIDFSYPANGTQKVCCPAFFPGLFEVWEAL